MATKLPYVVECKWPERPYFEPIAAFDVNAAAFRYARDCSATNHANGLEYRVVKGRKIIADANACFERPKIGPSKCVVCAWVGCQRIH